MELSRQTKTSPIIARSPSVLISRFIDAKRPGIRRALPNVEALRDAKVSNATLVYANRNIVECVLLNEVLAVQSRKDAFRLLAGRVFEGKSAYTNVVLIERDGTAMISRYGAEMPIEHALGGMFPLEKFAPGWIPFKNFDKLSKIRPELNILNHTIMRLDVRLLMQKFSSPADSFQIP